MMVTRNSLALSLLSLLAVRCAKDTVSFDEETQTQIGARGGTAESAAGALTLTVPDGVLADGSIVVIRTDRETTDAQRVGPLYTLSIEPALATFAKPIALEIINPNPAKVVALANFDGATPVVVEGATYDNTTKRARGMLTHFSRYGLHRLAPETECPTDQPPLGNGCTLDARMDCSYGEHECCSFTLPAFLCSCSGGAWACRDYANWPCEHCGDEDGGPPPDGG